MQIFIRGTQATHVVDVNGELTVLDLKSKVTALEGLSVDDQRLIFQGNNLDSDERQLSDCGIENLSTIDVTTRLLGGKVHGSLARAGKVKGQTPKVDAQEKKKKKTGRAKRRIQYNRRFVNVIAGVGGKRRGPNANVKA